MWLLFAGAFPKSASNQLKVSLGHIILRTYCQAGSFLLQEEFSPLTRVKVRVRKGEDFLELDHHFSRYRHPPSVDKALKAGDGESKESCDHGPVVPAKAV
jgi:hypothetical protein